MKFFSSYRMYLEQIYNQSINKSNMAHSSHGGIDADSGSIASSASNLKTKSLMQNFSKVNTLLMIQLSAEV